MKAMRWILVLPVSLLSSIFVALLGSLIFGTATNVVGETPFLSGHSILYFFQGLFFIVPIPFVAPSYKYKATLVGFGLYVSIMLINGFYFNSKYGIDTNWAQTILGIVGASMATAEVSLSNSKNE